MSPTARRRMPWYSGPTLLDYLESVDPETDARRCAVPHAGAARAARKPAISAAIPARSPRAGSASASASSMRDRAWAQRCGASRPWTAICSAAVKGDAVTLVLDTDLDISRGAVLSEVPRRPINADVIETRLVWLSETPFDPEAGYLLRTATDLTPVTSMSVSALVDFETLASATRPWLRRQRHRRLPHPARPHRVDRSLPRSAAHRELRPCQRH